MITLPKPLYNFYVMHFVQRDKIPNMKPNFCTYKT